MVVYTTCRKALARWEKETGYKAEDTVVVELMFQWPPIRKMDDNLSRLQACQKLSLSSNMIDSIAGVSKLKNLKCLSLARNHIKSLDGIEQIAHSLDELCISYNSIEKLKGVESMSNLKKLYISHNRISEWKEFSRLQYCEALIELVMVDNPLYSERTVDEWRAQVRLRLKQLDVLDGIPTREPYKPLTSCEECLDDEGGVICE